MNQYSPDFSQQEAAMYQAGRRDALKGHEPEGDHHAYLAGWRDGKIEHHAQRERNRRDREGIVYGHLKD